ncbi:hypothetical protein HYPSUDRAFT_703034 [Hypholoma sublateritium FD-334 SS-4]|uniref:Uncharacterized protein n=1 Tax=Hypholoma sublateritium (strain FD-334 SS-4) TaxID=945553 RepID=A0A0D2PC37_HYPSF|nr:hypothetical protein HYPSUDRAFT_703034 [Hypholoma sublateritium FD-334 SS-4]
MTMIIMPLVTPILVNYHPLTSSTQLAAALGPDNVPYTTEIATIPCAGVRISHGSLTGLLAWRLVVSNPLQIKPPRRTWWGTGDTTRQNEKAHYGTHRPPPTKHSNSDSEFTHPDMPPPKIWAAASTTSLPMKGGLSRHSNAEVHRIIPERPQSAMTVFDFPRYQAEEMEHGRQSSLGANLMQRNPAVATNFILDTSLPYSIISRDTLAALGYSPDLFPSPHADPHALDYDGSSEARNPDLIVSLSIQGVTTRVRIARPGEASRLGVQYLRDASVSVFFPRNGDGVGPVLYYESARLLRDVPLTITALPDHGRAGKPTLPQRVRALFGLS